MWNGEFLLWLSGLGTQHSTHEDAGSIPSLTQRVRDQCYCKLQHRLQMWLRSSVTVVVVYTSATAPIWPLVQKLPYATGVAIKGKINVWNISKENIFLSLKLLFSRLQKTTSVFLDHSCRKLPMGKNMKLSLVFFGSWSMICICGR